MDDLINVLIFVIYFYSYLSLVLLLTQFASSHQGASFTAEQLRQAWLPEQINAHLERKKQEERRRKEEEERRKEEEKKKEEEERKKKEESISWQPYTPSSGCSIV